MSEILIYIVLILLLSFLVFNNLDNFENQVISQYCVIYNQMCLNKNNPTYNEEWCNEYVNRCSPTIILVKTIKIPKFYKYINFYKSINFTNL